MRLQKRFNRKVGDREYSKWMIVLAPEDVEKLGWSEGEELETQVRDSKLVLMPKTLKKA
jgi:hypothetical protein